MYFKGNTQKRNLELTGEEMEAIYKEVAESIDQNLFKKLLERETTF